MSVPSQASVFSLAVQSEKQGDNALDVAAQSWYRTRAPRISAGTIQMQDNFPLETGGPIVPTGTFKAAQYGAGDVEMIPRVQEFIGYLLYGALGNVTSQTDAVWDTSTDDFSTPGDYTGVNAHRFTFDPASSYSQPWLALRTMTPGATPDKNFGQVFVDSKVSAMRLNVPAMGLLGSTVSFQSRKVTYPSAQSVNDTWVYQNTVEDSLSAVHAGRGSFLVGGEQHPITNASIEFVNNLTTPEEEMVVGSYNPDDFMAKNREMRVSITIKWQNADFYRKILTGSVSETDWQSLPLIYDSAGADKAFEATFYSPGSIPGSQDPDTNPVPYMLKVIANRMSWQIDRGGIELRAGEIIQVPYIGTVLEPAEGQEYCEFILHNDATYAFA